MRGRQALQGRVTMDARDIGCEIVPEPPAIARPDRLPRLPFPAARDAWHVKEPADIAQSGLKDAGAADVL